MLKIISADKAYQKMCAKFDSAQMYDGRGTEDIYECHDCDHISYTKYQDKGVTPFLIQCDKCGGLMAHVKTLPTVLIPADVIWYRPSFEEYKQLSPAQQQHVQQGGLIRKYVTPSQQPEVHKSNTN